MAGAPVRTHTTVTSVSAGRRRLPRRHRQRRPSVPVPWCWRAAPAIVPSVPAASSRPCRRRSSASRRSTTAIPDQLPDGGVLVVGASATGVQLADEIHRSGRPVTLSVGEHVRLPRTYRGRDVLWWMDASGVWNQRYDEIDDLDARARAAVAAARRHAGAHDARPQRAQRGRRRARRPAGRGARRPGALLGRTAQSVRAGRPQDGSAARHLRRVGARPRARCRRRPSGALRADARASLVTDSHLDLASGEIRSIVWATGFRPDYSWLDVPVRRSQGPPAARRRRGRCAGAVCDRAAGPPPPQVDLHPRRRGRRARHRRAPRRLPLLQCRNKVFEPVVADARALVPFRWRAPCRAPPATDIAPSR